MMHMNLRRCVSDARGLEKTLALSGGYLLDKRNLSEKAGVAEQFRDTVYKFSDANPDGNPEGLMYFHICAWDDPEDELTPETMQKISVGFADKIVPSGRMFVATGKEGKYGRVKSHVVICAVHPAYGLIPIRGADYADLKEVLVSVAKEYGVSPDGVSKKREPDGLTYGERQILARGGFSWKADLREKIDAAISSSKTIDEFFRKLEADGIQIMPTWSGRGFVYVHPKAKYPVTGERLGEKYTQDYINSVFGGSG